MKHIIQKQQFDISVSNIDHAKRVHALISDIYISNIVPQMDKLFSDYDNENTLSRLEKLELDLGVLSYDKLEEQLKLKINQALTKELEKKLSGYEIQPQTSLKIGDISTDINRDTEIDTPNSELKHIQHFLETGKIPWWIAESQTFNPEQCLLNLLQDEPQAVIRLITKLPGSYAVDRLIKQFSSHVHDEILTALMSPQNKEEIKQHAGYWNTLRKHTPSSITLPSNEDIREKLLFTVLTSPHSFSSKHFLTDALNDTDAELLTSLSTQDISLIHENMVKQLAPQSPEKNWIENRLHTLFHQTLNTEKIKSALAPSEQTNQDPSFDQVDQKKSKLTKIFDPTHTDNPLIDQSDIQKTLIKQSQKLTEVPINKQKKTGKAPEHSDTLDEPHYINNAGLILIWPFLNRFFKSLDLLTDKYFTSDQHQQRAVILSYYLQTGQTNVYEHNLLLNKLLCGWPINKPLRASIQPSDKEKRETRELLESVIQHWKTLKGTSIDGLRQSFLQREGRLTEKNYGYKLFINRMGIDVLLDQLPWGIGTIYLPWMEKTVFVEW